MDDARRQHDICDVPAAPRHPHGGAGDHPARHLPRLPYVDLGPRMAAGGHGRPARGRDPGLRGRGARSSRGGGRPVCRARGVVLELSPPGGIRPRAGRSLRPVRPRGVHGLALPGGASRPGRDVGSRPLGRGPPAPRGGPGPADAVAAAGGRTGLPPGGPATRPRRRSVHRPAHDRRPRDGFGRRADGDRRVPLVQRLGAGRHDRAARPDPRHGAAGGRRGDPAHLRPVRGGRPHPQQLSGPRRGGSRIQHRRRIALVRARRPGHL